MIHIILNSFIPTPGLSFKEEIHSNESIRQSKIKLAAKEFHANVKRTTSKRGKDNC